MQRYIKMSILLGIILQLLQYAGIQAAHYTQFSSPANIDISFTDQAQAAGLGLEQNSQGPVFFDENYDGIEDLYVSVGGLVAPGLNIFYRSRGDLSFEEATNEVGLLTVPEPTTMALAADFNNDGLTDLYVLNHDYLGTPNRMFFRQVGGGFLDVTAATGTGGMYESHDVLAWDYNGDSWLDLFITSANHQGLEPNVLYRNNGDGTFSDVAPSLGLDLPEDFAMGAAVGDYDNDGDADLYICNEFEPNRLFRNDNGFFTEVAAAAGVQASGVSKAAFFEDYDADGWLDLFVVSRSSSNQLFHNSGDGTFADVTLSAGIADNQIGRTGGWADFDNDGWLDVYVCNNQASNDLLWHNQGDGSFENVAASAGISNANYADALAVGDPNGDGFADLYVSNTDAQDRFYINSGNGNHWMAIAPSGRTSTNRSGVGVRVTVVTGNHRQMREVQVGGGYQSTYSIPIEFGLGNSASADSLILRWTDGSLTIHTNLSADQRYIAVEDSAIYPFSLPAVNVSALPQNPPIVIPPGGGSFTYNLELDNATGSPIALDFWTEVRLPNDASFGPILVRSLTLPPGTVPRTINQPIPAGAPAGNYTYYAYLGLLTEQTIWAFDSFDLSKTGSSGMAASWNISGWDEYRPQIEIADNASPQFPQLTSISPNPFNPSTAITFLLPEATPVKIYLYDLQGRKVLHLIEGFRPAGTYKLTLDGSSLPSGMYFLRLEASGSVQIKKAILIR